MTEPEIITEKTYIASTPILRVPHVTAQWTGDRLTAIEVTNLEDEGELSQEQFTKAWTTARRLKGRREESGTESRIVR